MQVKEITVIFGAKLNLGDYNSAHIETSVTAVLADGDDPEICRAQLLASAKDAVRAEARELMQKPKARVAEVLAGLPVEVAAQMKEEQDGNSRIN